MEITFFYELMQWYLFFMKRFCQTPNGGCPVLIVLIACRSPLKHTRRETGQQAGKRQSVYNLIHNVMTLCKHATQNSRGMIEHWRWPSCCDDLLQERADLLRISTNYTQTCRSVTSTSVLYRTMIYG